MQRLTFALLGGLALLSLAAPVYASQEGFAQWLEGFKAKAKAKGISEQVVNDAFADVVEDETVVRLDQKQPEVKINLSRYLKNTISERRITIGRDMLREHQEVLAKISAQYGVQPEYIIALWGIESDYGNNTGDFSVIQSLATLAYEGRRAKFFGEELLAALTVMQSENIPASDLVGSWAGAMGNCQFMPSTYLRFAADGNGDGKRDIWNSPEDTFASIASYLHSLGWNPQIGWGGKAKMPEGFAPSADGLKRGKTATSWHNQGVAFADSRTNMFPGDTNLYAIHPGSTERGMYLVTDNFKALLHWNRSRYFATAVGTLADAIGEQP